MNKKKWMLIVFIVTTFIAVLSVQNTQVYAEKLVPKDKNWTVTFNTVINPISVSNETIYVKDQEGNKVDEIELDMKKVFNTDGSVNFKKWYSTVEVKNTADYEAGDYTLVITDDVRNLFFQRLKKGVNFDFTVDTDEEDKEESEQGDEVNHKNEGEFFKSMDSQYISTDRFDYVDGNLNFDEEGYYQDVYPETTVNPNIQEDIKNVVKALYGENYVMLTYAKKRHELLPSEVNVVYEPDYGYDLNGSHAFDFSFYDAELYEGKYEAKLVVNNLVYAPENLIDGEMAAKPYKDALRDSIYALFSSHEEEIFNFIYGEHHKSSYLKNVDETSTLQKSFGDITLSVSYSPDLVVKIDY